MVHFRITDHESMLWSTKAWHTPDPSSSAITISETEHLATTAGRRGEPGTVAFGHVNHSSHF
jgi:hypothetical protein